MSYILSRGRGGGGGSVKGIWLCLDKTYLIPHKTLYYSYDLPSFAVNKQSIFYSPSIYFGGGDSSPTPFPQTPRPPCPPSLKFY